ncbi:unnamed protein product, partial [Effrenium voratum]
GPKTSPLLIHWVDESGVSIIQDPSCCVGGIHQAGRIRASSPSRALSSRAVNGNAERRVVGERHITREELMETGNLVQGDPGRRVTREDPFLPSRGLAQMAPASGASGYEQHASYMAPVTYASAMNQPLVSSAASGAVNYAVSPSANCRNCGNTYAADSNFCRKCGTKRG